MCCQIWLNSELLNFCTDFAYTSLEIDRSWDYGSQGNGKGMSRNRKGEKKSTIVSGVILLGMGLYFLAIYEEVVPSFHRSWPIFLIIVGIAIIIGSFTRRSKETENQTNDQTR